MPYLDKALRQQLAKTIARARVVAEEAAEDALRRLGVAEDAAPNYLSEPDRALRRMLRAHARSLGDGWDPAAKRLLSTTHLMQTAAFEHWHRMLFGRFLVERGLLVHPELGAAIAREELDELAADEGLADGWALVERIAAPALPAVFKPGDPALALALAPEFAKRLRDLVTALPEAVFTADDALGWTYQFWRAAEKDAVNKAGGKIGAAELPAVTQLFTEPYMVLFLLHNTLGAWWAARRLAADPALAADAADELELRAACALPGVDWAYLRFVRDNGTWRPGAGGFPGWPEHAAEITFCDPCCGSGHFLVEGFRILAALRQAEEGLAPAEAARAVLRDNLHGLELDGRCVQIAAFNVALAAWGLAGGPVPLPVPHLAWVGAPPPMSRTEMAALSNGDAGLSRALEALYDQFAQAPLLGSLLEVGARDLLDAELLTRGEEALARLREGEPERVEGAVAARGLLDAATLLGRKYVLLATNVPFLLRRKHALALAEFIQRSGPEGKADLATAMLLRIGKMTTEHGIIASVTPQNWLFLGFYKLMREKILNSASLSVVAGLGPRAFETIMGEVVNAALVIIRRSTPDLETVFTAVNANKAINPFDKSLALRGNEALILNQVQQLGNPDTRISFNLDINTELLSKYAFSPNGMHGADAARFRGSFWERMLPNGNWTLLQSTVSKTSNFGGREHVFWWPDHGRWYDSNVQARIQGVEAWSKGGVVVSLMGDLSVTRYSGEKFDISCSPIVPKNQENISAIWAFCSSPIFSASVRRIDQALKVTNGTLVKIPFDLAHWQAVAAERYPDGLPEPYSDDPTQWLFHGHPAHAESGTELHVALARLAGYRWPAETDPDMRLAPLARERITLAAALSGADEDGLLPLHTAGDARPLADRLRALLAAAYGAPLTPRREAELVRAADLKLDRKEARDASPEAWLRDRAFRQHSALFHNRPFLWHVWDGLRDGFSAFLHYHRLDRAALERLIYTLLGDWIARAGAEGQTAREERARVLQQKLTAILQGEVPHDIFVRWKPLGRQPVGWTPDLDDGVRLNIRPFMQAEVLREQPRGIAWGKDRGTDVASAPWYGLALSYGEKPGTRINDHHLSLAEKQATRARAAE